MTNRYDKLVSTSDKVIAGDNSLVQDKLSDYVDQAPPVRKLGRGANQKQAADGVSYVQPMVETAYTDREHYTERSVKSSDGLMLLRVKQVKKIKFKDSNTDEAKKKVFDLEFKQKPVTPPAP